MFLIPRLGLYNSYHAKPRCDICKSECSNLVKSNRNKNLCLYCRIIKEKPNKLVYDSYNNSGCNSNIYKVIPKKKIKTRHQCIP